MSYGIEFWGSEALNNKQNTNITINNNKTHDKFNLVYIHNISVSSLPPNNYCRLRPENSSGPDTTVTEDIVIFQFVISIHFIFKIIHILTVFLFSITIAIHLKYYSFL